MFPESKVVAVVRWGGLFLFSAGAFASWVYGRDLRAALIFGVLAVLAFFARGDSIVIDSKGVSGASVGSESGSGVERCRFAGIQRGCKHDNGDR